MDEKEKFCALRRDFSVNKRMSVGEIFYILFSDESHPGSSVREGFHMEKRSVVIFALH